MRDVAVARRYAQAAIDSAGKDIAKVGEELSSFAEAYSESEDLRKILIHPGIKLEDKQRVISGIAKGAKFSAKVQKILEIVLEKGRIGVIPEIAESYSEMADTALNQVKVSVSSAQKVSDDELKKLEEAFSAITGKKARVEVEVNKNLIGGIVAKVGSKVYDGSLSNQLRLMKVKLEEEA